MLAAMLASIAHRGPDGSDLQFYESAGLGHQHFWTTPEEVDVRQPVASADGKIQLLLDGRLDNRRELLTALNLDEPAGRKLGDAQIILSAYQVWGDRCFARLLGPFAVVIYDFERHQLVCARDTLGDRTLFYHINRHYALFASEEQAILAHPEVSESLDNTTVAHYFASRSLGGGHTFFKDVSELLPASVLTVGRGEVRTWQFWHFEPIAWSRKTSDREYAEQYLEILEKSVSCRLRSSSSTGTLMSGGLDSTSVAAIAARLIAPNGGSSGTNTFSWVFEELKEADESLFIKALNERYGNNANGVVADELWPLRDIETWPLSLNGPDSDPFERAHEAAYRSASGQGIRVLLTGLFSDQLYAGVENWLVDLIRDRQFSQAAGALWHASRRHGIGRVLYSHAVRRVAGTLLDGMPGGRWFHRPRLEKPAWMRPSAAQQLEGPDCCSAPTAAKARRPWQARSAFSNYSARMIARKISNASKFGIDLRHPFRDLRLVTLFLSLPAYQFYGQGQDKFIARNAMHGILPEVVRQRTLPTQLTSLFLRGLADRVPDHVAHILGAPGATWTEYVRPELIPTDPRGLRQCLPQLSDPELAVVWSCICFELWHSHLKSERLA